MARRKKWFNLHLCHTSWVLQSTQLKNTKQILEPVEAFPPRIHSWESFLSPFLPEHPVKRNVWQTQVSDYSIRKICISQPQYSSLFVKTSSMPFIMRNESFTCQSCHKRVSEHPTGSARNHCPYCLCSLHVDRDFPWDRASQCRGIMDPYAIDQTKKW